MQAHSSGLMPLRAPKGMPYLAASQKKNSQSYRLCDCQLHKLAARNDGQGALVFQHHRAWAVISQSPPQDSLRKQVYRKHSFVYFIFDFFWVTIYAVTLALNFSPVTMRLSVSLKSAATTNSCWIRLSPLKLNTTFWSWTQVARGDGD